MDALGLLALANSSGGSHGSFIFSFMGTKTYRLSNDNFEEIDRFDVGVTITAAAVCYQLSNSGMLVNVMKLSATGDSFSIQAIPPASQYDTFESIRIHSTTSIKFAYDGTHIVVYAYSDDGSTDTIRGTFLGIVSY